MGQDRPPDSLTELRQLAEWAAGRLKYAFAQPELLMRALTHPGFGENNNRRLEFLGDAVLELVSSDSLYRRYEDALEGRLTHMRQRLVQRATLAEVAEELDLGGRLRYQGADLAPGGPAHQAMLADALEAVFAAVWLDGGVEPAAALFEKLFGERLDAVTEQPRDAKSLLQEYLQGRGLKPPDYRLARSGGGPQAPNFRSICAVPELLLSAQGDGRTIQASEIEAASAILAQIGGAA